MTSACNFPPHHLSTGPCCPLNTSDDLCINYRPHQDRARSGAMGASAAELDAFVDVAMGRRDVTTLELLPAGQV